jgi:poly [ADP-ribose] polymerase 10/14/15
MATLSGTESGPANLSSTGSLLWPHHWTSPIYHEGGARTTLVPLDENTGEYKDVASRFYSSLPNYIIDTIERVQAPHIWQSYQLKRRQMGGHGNEQRLYHGTVGRTKVDGIAQNGFNRSYAGDVNGRAYGAGVYFGITAATSSSYSDNKEGTMFEASVLVGNATVGNSSMKVPPCLPGDPSRLYDSTTDNTATPTMFVTYHDDQAVPDYLISYHAPFQY